MVPRLNQVYLLEDENDNIATQNDEHGRTNNRPLTPVARGITKLDVERQHSLRSLSLVSFPEIQGEVSGNSHYGSNDEIDATPTSTPPPPLMQIAVSTKVFKAKSSTVNSSTAEHLNTRNNTVVNMAKINDNVFDTKAIQLSTGDEVTSTCVHNPSTTVSPVLDIGLSQEIGKLMSDDSYLDTLFLDDDTKHVMKKLGITIASVTRKPLSFFETEIGRPWKISRQRAEKRLFHYEKLRREKITLVVKEMALFDKEGEHQRHEAILVEQRHMQEEALRREECRMQRAIEKSERIKKVVEVKKQHLLKQKEDYLKKEKESQEKRNKLLEAEREKAERKGEQARQRAEEIERRRLELIAEEKQRAEELMAKITLKLNSNVKTQAYNKEESAKNRYVSLICE